MAKIKTVNIWGGHGVGSIDTRDAAIFQGIEFVSRAVTLDNSVFKLRDMYFDKPNLVATDGHRLHLFEMPEDALIPGGFYRVIRKTKSLIELGYVGQGQKFPEYKNILPDAASLTKIAEGAAGGYGRIESLYATVIRGLSVHNTSLRYSYVKDLGDVAVWDVYIDQKEEKGNRAGILFKSHKMKALIMPVRV